MDILGIILIVLLVAAVVFANLRHKGRSWDVEIHVHDTEDEDEQHGR